MSIKTYSLNVTMKSFMLQKENTFCANTWSWGLTFVFPVVHGGFQVQHLLPLTVEHNELISSTWGPGWRRTPTATWQPVSCRFFSSDGQNRLVCKFNADVWNKTQIKPPENSNFLKAGWRWTRCEVSRFWGLKKKEKKRGLTRAIMEDSIELPHILGSTNKDRENGNITWAHTGWTF